MLRGFVKKIVKKLQSPNTVVTIEVVKAGSDTYLTFVLGSDPLPFVTCKDQSQGKLQGISAITTSTVPMVVSFAYFQSSFLVALTSKPASNLNQF